jgi:hypothetical protein
MVIPFILEVAAVLAAFTNWCASLTHRIDSYAHGPGRSSRFIQLPPSCNFNDFGYMPFILETVVSGKGYIYVQWFSDKGSISGVGDGLNPFAVFPDNG